MIYSQKNENKIPTIAEFFEGQVIFITGGTGFMGKVLIEKLLWSCPGIDTIYLLMRPKKGVDGKQRLINLEKSLLFERVRKRDPCFFHQKVKLINGDVCELNLGLSDEDRVMLINSVSVIYHAAASVRFDDPLKQAVIMNTRGTREIMMFANEIKNLKFFLHVSTTYCNTDKDIVEEILYPPHADWKTTIKMVETMDESTINTLTPKYMENLPNTYVFTKSLAEHVVNDLHGNFPTLIFRPSIVVSSVNEPFPGWIENFNGPVGLLVACGKGVMRTMYSKQEIKTDVIPVDFAIKAMLIATWKYAVTETKVSKTVPVINCGSGNSLNLTYHKIIEMGLIIVNNIPFNNILWIPGGAITHRKLVYITSFIFFHMVPALLVDIVLKLSGNKPMLWRLQRRVYVATNALRYYITNEWLFKNENFIKLNDLLLLKDVEDFSYDVDNVEIFDFFQNAVLGARRYLLKEVDETIPQAQTHFKRMFYLDLIVKIIFWCTLFWCIYSSYFSKYCTNVLF